MAIVKSIYFSSMRRHSLLSSLQPCAQGWIRTHITGRNPCSADMPGSRWRPDLITQIYEGTNQVQRVVIAKRLLS